MNLDVAKWFDEEFETTGGSPNVTKSLSALTATFSAGVLTPAISNALTASTATFTEGTPTPALSYGLNGQTATFSLGTIAPAITYGVTGQTATFTEGTISATTGQVENLTGQTATFSIGTITPSLSYPLTGQTANFTQGSLISNPSYGLTGQTITSSPGSITPEVDYAVQGLTATFGEGVITAQAGGNISRSLTGLAAAFSVGTITVTGGDSQGGAGKHRKRYGVLDGWRLLLFNTKADVDAFKASLKQAKKPEQVRKRIKIVEPAEVINLPQLKRSLPPPQAASVDQMIRERRYGEVSSLSNVAAQYDAQRRAKEEAEVIEATQIVQAHRQMTSEHIQRIHQALKVLRIHQALKVLHDIRRLRRIQ